MKHFKFVDFDDDSDVEVDSNADAANHQEGTVPTKLPSIHHWYKHLDSKLFNYSCWKH